MDICPKRLQVCKKIVKKYHFEPQTSGREYLEQESSKEFLTRCRLFCSDGTTFHNNVNNNRGELIFDSIAELEEDSYKKGSNRKRMNKSARARERKRLKTIESSSSVIGDELTSKLETEVFDRVLVDAECSTDGSTKHLLEQIKKRDKNNDRGPCGLSSGVSTKLIHESGGTLEKLHALQRDLISQGFRNLKPGGILVYSTCSLSRFQNEEIVSYLISCFPTAFIIPFSSNDVSKELHEIASISDNGTIRFSYGCLGGFFLARIGKKHNTQNSI